MEIEKKQFANSQIFTTFKFSLKEPDNFIMKVQLQKVLHYFLKPIAFNITTFSTQENEDTLTIFPSPVLGVNKIYNNIKFFKYSSYTIFDINTNIQEIIILAPNTFSPQVIEGCKSNK